MGLCFIWYKNNAAAFFSMHVHACPLFQEGVNETLSSNSSEKQDAQNEHLATLVGPHPRNKIFYKNIFERQNSKSLVFNLEIK